MAGLAAYGWVPGDTCCMGDRRCRQSGVVVVDGAIEEQRATLRNGVTMPYAETGGPGSSLPVILVHAYVETWRSFEPLLRALPPSIHALAPTQRGHPSVEGVLDSYRASDFAADLVGFMDTVGIDRAVLVGASSGGVICRMVATGHPRRVAALVLISSPVSLADKPGITAARKEIMGLLDPVDARFVEKFVRSTSPSGMSEECLAQLVSDGLATPARVWRESLVGLLHERPEALECIGAPTLLLAGGADSFVRDDQQTLLDRIPGAEIIVYEGVGHSPHLAHPDRVAADLTTFVHGH